MSEIPGNGSRRRLKEKLVAKQKLPKRALLSNFGILSGEQASMPESESCATMCSLRLCIEQLVAP